MSLLSLQNLRLVLANTVILDQADWHIQPKDRIALVGRNGAGKSTVLKLLQGELTPDSGQRRLSSGLRVAGLSQEVPVSTQALVFEVMVKGLGALGDVLIEYRRQLTALDSDALSRCHARLDEAQAWDRLPKLEALAQHLGLDLDASMSQLSGGMKRRVLLASALAEEPDLLLLDEPTNHLDLPSIEWLESYLDSYPGALVLVTHDRAFLSRVSKRIVEIDRGRLQQYDCDYETFLDRREALRLADQQKDQLFDKRLSEEEVWLRTGVKARRTRNEGRVRALKAMREAHSQRRQQMGQVKTLALDVARSGQTVIEVTGVSYSWNQNPIVQDFSLLVTRGDKLGIIGPNGCGKTTLLRVLLGELAPSSGTVRRGTGVEVAYFDQLRRQLDESQTVMANVADGAEHVTINGQSKHVASYLRDFLFAPERFNQPVSVLSGGERNRLLLAKLLAKPVNLLVMDEPTNDLDIETLELLERVLVEYPGTLLLISHDRAFINQVVTSVLVYEGKGHFEESVGSYEDYQRQRKAPEPEVVKVLKKPVTTALSYQEQRELNKLPQQIEVLEKKIAELYLTGLDPKSVLEHETKLAAFYQRWALLEAKG